MRRCPSGDAHRKDLVLLLRLVSSSCASSRVVGQFESGLQKSARPHNRGMPDRMGWIVVAGLVFTVVVLVVVIWNFAYSERLL